MTNQHQASSSSRKEETYSLGNLNIYIVTGNRPLVEETLMHKPKLVNALDSDGSTPLHFAALRLDAHKIFPILFKYGANEKIKNSDSKTALDVAKEIDNKLAIAFLKDEKTIQRYKSQFSSFIQHAKNDKLDSRTLHREFPYVLQVVNMVDSNGWTALDYMVYHKQYAMVKTLLKLGADINHSEGGKTALHIAVVNEDTTMLKMLLDKKYECLDTPVSFTYENKTFSNVRVMDLAKELGNKDVISLLKQAGADSGGKWTKIVTSSVQENIISNHNSNAIPSSSQQSQQQR